MFMAQGPHDPLLSRNRLHAKPFRGLAPLPHLHHCCVRGFDMARQTLGVEQRMAEPVLRQPLTQRAEQRRVAGKLQGERFIVIKAIRNELRQSHRVQQTRRDAARQQARSRKPLDVNNARRALRSPEANHGQGFIAANR